MTPTKLPPCVFRGEVLKEDGDFACLNDLRDSKVANLSACNECLLRQPQGFIENVASNGPGFIGSVVSAATRIVSGAVGTAKAYFGIDPAPESEVQRRYSICETCEMNVCGQCLHAGCNCFIGTKIRIASQSCPLEKWLTCNADVQSVHGRKD